MHTRSARTLFVTTWTAAILAVAGCGSLVELQSQPAAEPVQVDGSTVEWSGHLTRVEDGRMSVGVQHDDENVYVAFITRDTGTLRNLLRSGFTVWFDAGGGKEKTFGVQFPIGRLAAAGQRPTGDPGMRPTGDGDRPDVEATEGGPLFLIDAAGIPERFAPDQAEGVRVRATMDLTSIVYELSVARSMILQGGEMPAVMGVGFESPQFDAGSGGPDVAGAAARGGGGRGGRGGRGGGGIGDLTPSPGGGPAGGRSTTQPVKVWTRVLVANGVGG